LIHGLNICDKDKQKQTEIGNPLMNFQGK